MGWATLPIFTFTPPATFSTTGTCFSFAASVVFSFISFMGLPQHTSSPAPPCRTSTILPQTSHLYTSSLFAMMNLRSFRLSVFLSNFPALFKRVMVPIEIHNDYSCTKLTSDPPHQQQ